jgi:alpha-L-fucosidase 2
LKRLWYRQPAAAWEETLPLGNGSLGAMVWGDPQHERIGLNQERLWSGYYADHTPKEAAAHLPQVRRLIFEKQYEKAERIMEQYFLGEYTESYMPAGELWIDCPPAKEIQQYQRELVLDTAEARVSYMADGNTVQKQYFVSYLQKALIIRLEAQKPVSRIEICYQSELKKRCFEEQEWGMSFGMQCPEHVDPNYLGEREEAIIWGSRGMQFPVEIHVLETDGSWHTENETLIFEETKKIIFAVSILDSFVPLTGGYEAYERAHLEDYQALYRRMELEMPGKDALPTDEWMAQPDAGLYALYFQYGRYLLISSSRQGGLPANLQGIWSWQMRAPWSSNWTTNINLEMNYWPALSVNLQECDEPYIDMVRRLCMEGRKTAAAFGCRGSCCAHNTDGWGTTHPVGIARGETGGEKGCLMWAFWLMAQVWMDQEVWRYYWYHPDQRYLKETVYPLLKESVLFCLDWLTEYEGYYVTCPSTTPENQFWSEGGRISVSLATTMDMTLIRELFRNFARASQELGETELLKEIEEKKARLYPIQKNADGSVCEWYEEKAEVEPGHRHLSHLYGLFPADLWREDEGMKQAAQKSLEKRMAAGSGHTGWSLAWVLNLYTVLKDASSVQRYLEQLIKKSSYPNLWSKHPPFQIDGNFGVTAAIAHMLAEEKEGEINLLPCLPPDWQEGRVSGLCLPGGKQVSFAWKQGRVTEQSIL